MGLGIIGNKPGMRDDDFADVAVGGFELLTDDLVPMGAFTVPMKPGMVGKKPGMRDDDFTDVTMEAFVLLADDTDPVVESLECCFPEVGSLLAIRGCLNVGCWCVWERDLCVAVGWWEVECLLLW